MSTKKKTKEEIENIVKECYSIADVCRMIGWKPIGGNYRVVHRYIDDYNIDISHFKEKSNFDVNKNNTIEKPCEYYFNNNVEIKSKTFLKKLIKEGYKEHKCENCNNTEWMGDMIPLELHHIDGNHRNNKLENLQFLCPNCHAKTDNFRGKKNKKHHCKKCGAPITSDSESGYCFKCYPRNKKNEWDKETLVKDITELGSYLAVSKKYNVSDKTIKKWCEKFGIKKENT